MYDSTQYEVLLHRGLEYLDLEDLKKMLKNKKGSVNNDFTSKIRK